MNDESKVIDKGTIPDDILAIPSDCKTTEDDSFVYVIHPDHTVDRYRKKPKQEKPPLGVAPAYIVHGDRIKGLCSAISRYSDNLTSEEDRGFIKKWAKEILALCEYDGY